VNSDEQVQQHKFKCIMDHAERCEAVRHCRWVDEVVPDAPWVINAAFLEKHNIDYVAHDDEPYLSAGHDDVYAFVKSLGLSRSPSVSFWTPHMSPGKFIPTRRTPGISTSSILERIVKGYRNNDFDMKLEKMGCSELMAQGLRYGGKVERDDPGHDEQLSR
jgi:choline-phosphate cytidylyltransferase